MIAAVMLGAGIGAALRYRLDRVISRSRPGPFPLGTLTINMLGSFVLGILVGWGASSPDPRATLDPATIALLGTGLCGGFTTFSTFSYEAVRLLEDGWRLVPMVYLAASLAGGLLAGGLGLFLAGGP